MFIITYPFEMHSIIKTRFWSWKYLNITHKIIWVMKEACAQPFLNYIECIYKIPKLMYATCWKWIHCLHQKCLNTATTAPSIVSPSHSRWFRMAFRGKTQKNTIININQLRGAMKLKKINISHILSESMLKTEWQYCWLQYGEFWLIYKQEPGQRGAACRRLKYRERVQEFKCCVVI